MKLNIKHWINVIRDKAKTRAIKNQVSLSIDQYACALEQLLPEALSILEEAKIPQENLDKMAADIASTASEITEIIMACVGRIQNSRTAAMWSEAYESDSLRVDRCESIADEAEENVMAIWGKQKKRKPTLDDHMQKLSEFK